MKDLAKYISLGLGHGVNDLVSAWVLVLAVNLPQEEFMFLLIGYNLLAFGGQYVLSRLLPDNIRSKPILLSCFALMTASLLVVNWSASLAVVFIGVSSAFYHLIGGVESVREDNQSWGFGIFLAPGVVGLGIGAYMANVSDITHIVQWIPVGLLFLFALFYPNHKVHMGINKVRVEVEKHDVLMVVLLLLFSVRSLFWNVSFQHFYMLSDKLLMLIAVAFVAKLFGGFMADLAGHYRYTMISLVLASGLIWSYHTGLVSTYQPFWYFLPLFLIQSTIAPTVSMLLATFKGKIGVGISLVLGVAILIGILPIFQELRRGELLRVVAVLLPLSLLSLFLILRKKQLD